MSLAQIQLANPVDEHFQPAFVMEVQQFKHAPSIEFDEQAIQEFKEGEELRGEIQAHLIARVQGLCELKRKSSGIKWQLIRLSDDRSHEHSLYWKLVLAAPSIPIDQYAFQLCYYLMEYESKRLASNLSECVQNPHGKCILEANLSSCRHCTWVIDQTKRVEQIIRERSEPSANHWTVDVLYYIAATMVIGWIALLSVFHVPGTDEFLTKKWILHVVQELSYQSFGYVYSSERIRVSFQKWYNRLVFACFVITVQTLVVFVQPVVQYNWATLKTGRFKPWDVNTGVEVWILLALTTGIGVLACTSLAIIPTRDETIEQKKYLDVDLLNSVNMKLYRSEQLRQTKDVSNVTLPAKELLLMIVSQDQKRPHDTKRVMMALMSVLVAGTGPTIALWMTNAPFSSCPATGCGIWPEAFVRTARGLQLPLVIMLMFMLQNAILVGTQYIWRKSSIQERYLKLVEGTKAKWCESAAVEPLTDEVVQLDLADRDTVVGFGMIVNLLENQDGTEKRRTETSLAIVISGFILLSAWALFQFTKGNFTTDGWLLNWLTIWLCLIIIAYLSMIVVPNGIMINTIPAKLFVLVADQVGALSQRKALIRNAKLAQQWVDQPQKQSQLSSQSLQNTLDALTYLLDDFKTVIFVRPFALLCIELTIARGSALLSSGVSVVGFIAKAIAQK